MVACHRQSHGRKPSEVHLCRWPPAGSAGWLRQQGAPGPCDGGHGGVRIRERQGASRRRRGVELFWSRLQRRRYGTFHLLSSQRPAPSPRRERFRRSSTTSAISTRSTRRRRSPEARTGSCFAAGIWSLERPWSALGNDGVRMRFSTRRPTRTSAEPPRRPYTGPSVALVPLNTPGGRDAVEPRARATAGPRSVRRILLATCS